MLLDTKLSQSIKKIRTNNISLLWKSKPNDKTPFVQKDEID